MPLAIHPSVLLVLPDADDRAMYVEYFRDAGLRSVLCERTDDAVACASDADVIVTGVRLPGSFDGIELLRRLRSNEATKEKPAIVVTASLVQSERERSEAAGCAAFWAKPCLPETLVAEIYRVLARRRPRVRHATEPA
jgi:two-component system, cell cycle response regulator DivK